jgi:hypothetical protein
MSKLETAALTLTLNEDIIIMTATTITSNNRLASPGNTHHH